VKTSPKEKVSTTRSSTKVVTDIDDTVKSSGGVKLFGIPLGGIDVKF
jgi:phosphatidate phosphatase APP1